MATHGLIVVEMKAHNELSFSVPVCIKSVKKWKYVLWKKEKQNKMTKRKQ